MFDSVFGMVIHAAGRPISRTGVSARRLPQGDADRHAADRARLGPRDRGPQGFVNAELRDPDDNLLAEANGLMIRLLAGPAMTIA